MSYTPRTSPDHELTGWPKGVKYIIGNEGCERFSFYGMKAILFVYVLSLYEQLPQFSERADAEATALVHLFVAGVYGLAMIGAVVADRLLGKYMTIMTLSMVYCSGHFVLALSEGPIYESLYAMGLSSFVDEKMGSAYGLWLGLGLIAVGSGGIKPCVSAHVGDQFGKGNWSKVRTVFQYFYFIINFGSMFATLLIPWVRNHYGNSIAFGIPGILMALATLAFWMGRKQFIHVPAKPAGRLGLLDALSSTLLFLAVGHLFFTGGTSLATRVIASLAFLTAGLMVFAWRQRIKQDDGFLAVLVYSMQSWLRREPAMAAATGAGTVTLPVGRDDSDAVLIAKLTDGVSSGVAERRTKLVRSPLFGHAVRKFGIEATEGPVAVLKIIGIFLFVSVFWALFDQHSSSWIRQGQTMNTELWSGFSILPEQFSALNPLMVMILIPVMSLGVYPALEKMGIRMSPLRRMTGGMFIAALSFVIVAVLQATVENSPANSVSIVWQILPYFIITLAEVLVSITGLEFAYTQAPTRMKSTIMGFWLLAVSLGNVLTAVLFKDLQLSLSGFFWTFAAMMAVAAVLFGTIAYFYKYQDYVQD